MPACSRLARDNAAVSAALTLKGDQAGSKAVSRMPLSMAGTPFAKRSVVGIAVRNGYRARPRVAPRPAAVCAATIRSAG